MTMHMLQIDETMNCIQIRNVLNNMKVSCSVIETLSLNVSQKDTAIQSGPKSKPA